ncbi:MAG: hypothetical protein DRI69_05215 [Bacteroidetes bacterium]|nr:MAG: hypothetical protein DRI69_05215 [Bacteroidota bacterium]
MLTRLKQILYNFKLRRYRTTNLHLLPDKHFQNIKSIGIVFDATSEKNHKSILNFQNKLKDEGRDVQLLGFFNQKEEPGPQTFSYFYIDGVGFAMTPTSDVAKQFIEHPFDVLINLDYDCNTTINYICAASRALFKIGPATGNPDHYDLMIDLGEHYKMGPFIKEIRSTFNLIN